MNVKEIRDKSNDELLKTLDEFKKFSSLFDEDIYKAIDLLTCVQERKVIGGPSTESVKIQLEALNKFINDTTDNLSKLS